MKQKEGKHYKAKQLKPAADQKTRQPGEAKRTDAEQKIRIALQRNEIHHLCHKDDPGYDDSEYHNRKADLIIQLATLQSGRQLQRSDDGKLIEYRAISFTNKGENKNE